MNAVQVVYIYIPSEMDTIAAELPYHDSKLDIEPLAPHDARLHRPIAV